MDNVKEKLEKGIIQAKIIIEIVGKPKEHVEDTIKGYVEKIKKNFDVISIDIAEVKKAKEQEMFSTFVELELLVKDLNSLIGFCFDYMPSSIEIIEPKQFALKETDIGNLLTELQGKLHHLDMMIKQVNNENKFLKSNTSNLMKNMIRLLIFKDGMELEGLARIMGIDKKDLEKFLDVMIKKEHVEKKENKYFWKK